MLLSLRVNALQIPPDQRRNFVSQLIKIDIFNVTSSQSLEFPQIILGMNNHGLKHALSALISVIVSTAEGVEYLTHAEPKKMDLSILENLIDILKE